MTSTSGRSKAGRRPRSGSAEVPPGLSRDEILAHIVSAHSQSFGEVSIAQIARDLDVAPSLIHYHFGTRAELQGLLANLALREVVSAAPEQVGNWRWDFEQLIRTLYDVLLRWKGVALASANEYRLFQSELVDGIDYGMQFFNRAALILRDAGFDPAQAARTYHVVMLFTTSAVRADLLRQEPQVKREYMVEQASRFDIANYPGTAYMLSSFTRLEARESFEAGLAMLLDAAALELPEQQTKSARSTRP